MACCCIEDKDTNDDQTNIRRCTDVLCLCIFIIFIFLMMIISGFSFIYGDPARLRHGSDSFGNTCGSSFKKYSDSSVLDLSEKKFVFYFDVRDLKNSLRICVEKCPDTNIKTINDLEDFYTRRSSSLCSYDVDINNLTSYRYLDSKYYSQQRSASLKFHEYSTKPAGSLHSYDQETLDTLEASKNPKPTSNFSAKYYEKSNEQSFSKNQTPVLLSYYEQQTPDYSSKQQMSASNLSDEHRKYEVQSYSDNQISDEHRKSAVIYSNNQITHSLSEQKTRDNNSFSKQQTSSYSSLEHRTSASLYFSEQQTSDKSFSKQQTYFLSSDQQTSDEISFDQKTSVLHSSLGPCPPFPIYKSVAVLNRCIPEPVEGISDEVFSDLYGLLNSQHLVQQVLSAVYKTWLHILGFTFLSLVLSMSVIFMLHVLAGRIAHIILCTVCVTSTLGTVFVWWTFYQVKIELDRTPLSQLLTVSAHNEHVLSVLVILSIVLTVIMFLLVISIWSRLNFVDTLFKETSASLRALPCLFIQPVISFVLLIAFFTCWISVVVRLVTSNYPGQKQEEFVDLKFSSNTTIAMSFAPLNSTLPAVTSEPMAILSSLIPLNNITSIDSDHTKAFAATDKVRLLNYADASWISYMSWVYVFGLLWIPEVFLACQQMVTAGAVARWYFHRARGGSASKWLIMRSLRTMWMYHLGSMALGALLITVFKIPRLVLCFLNRNVRGSQQTIAMSNQWLRPCINSFTGLSYFIRCVHHNAYTVVAMQGIDFCPGCQRVTTVQANNTLNLTTVNSAGDVILFLAKCIVTCVTGSAAILVLREDSSLEFFSAPLIVICALSFCMSHFVLSVYAIVKDTLVLCMSEDHYMNGKEGHWKKSALLTAWVPQKVGNEGDNETIVLSEVPELAINGV